MTRARTYIFKYKDMADETRLRHIIRRLWRLHRALIAALIACLIVSLLAGCRAKQTVTADTRTLIQTHADTVTLHDTVTAYDSVFVSVMQRGDTVYSEKTAVRYRDRYRDRYTAHTDTVIHTDTVTVTAYAHGGGVSVWERLKDFALMIVAITATAAALWFMWKAMH